MKSRRQAEPPPARAPGSGADATGDAGSRPEWVRQIEQEHATLRTLLRALESRLALERDVREWSKAVGETLSALVPALQSHFVREERELSPERIAASFPNLAQRIAELNAEHAEILTAFTRARQECMERPSDPELKEELTRDLSIAAADLRRHEVAESELLAVGHWFDLPEHR